MHLTVNVMNKLFSLHTELSYCVCRIHKRMDVVNLGHVTFQYFLRASGQSKLLSKMIGGNQVTLCIDIAGRGCVEVQ